MMSFILRTETNSKLSFHLVIHQVPNNCWQLMTFNHLRKLLKWISEVNDQIMFSLSWLTITQSFYDPDDGNTIKHLLTRLTHRPTFPNILFRGKSIGGSDDLNQLHVDKALAELIEQAGATPKSDGSTK
jgi:glutaredoxin